MNVRVSSPEEWMHVKEDCRFIGRSVDELDKISARNSAIFMPSYFPPAPAVVQYSLQNSCMWKCNLQLQKNKCTLSLCVFNHSLDKNILNLKKIPL